MFLHFYALRRYIKNLQGQNQVQNSNVCKWVCQCANMQVCKYANVQVCKCASVQMCKCANVQVCECASMQICKCVGQFKVWMCVSSFVWARDLWRSALFFSFLVSCFIIFLSDIADTGSKWKLKLLFLYGADCVNSAKKETFFLPEFSICLCISSSVAIQMIKICTENTSEGGREKRGRREERNRPRKEAHNDHMI